MKKTLKILALTMTVLLVMAVGSPLEAAYILTDGNSSVSIDPGSPAGTYSWMVNGVNHLYKQWFWFRVGPSGPEASIDALALTNQKTIDSDGDGDLDILALLYSGTGFEIYTKFILAGGSPGSKTSDMSEQIRITNLGSSPLDFHFFQFNDFDLNGTAQDDTAARINANTMKQWDPYMVYSEVVVSPAPNHWQISNTGAILTALSDGSATTLLDAQNPLSGNVSWAFQWDFNIPAGGSALIVKDKVLDPAAVPSPTALVLLASGLIGLVGLRRKRKL